MFIVCVGAEIVEDAHDVNAAIESNDNEVAKTSRKIVQTLNLCLRLPTQPEKLRYASLASCKPHRALEIEFQHSS